MLIKQILDRNITGYSEDWKKTYFELKVLFYDGSIKTMYQTYTVESAEFRRVIQSDLTYEKQENQR